jgi:DNA-binding transcriptional regulator YiaG
LKTFESDLEALNHYGLKPAFDPVTYPVDIQPLWAKLSDIPEDAEEALEFWTNDGQSDRRLTDSGPRGKWNRLMNARILCFELPPEWEQTAACSIKKKEQASKQYQKKNKNHAQPVLSGEQIIKAREKLRLSQRELAGLIGKSQSWIRDVERGRFRVKPQDQILLQRVLGKQNS